MCEDDRIYGLGDIIGKCAHILNLPGQHSNYGRWNHARWMGKKSVTRKKVQECVDIFTSHPNHHLILDELNIISHALK